MDFRILGPLEVSIGDSPVTVGGAKPRGLLAVLLLHANEVVSHDRLIDALWGERPPETALKALQVYVSQLRKAIGKTAIHTRPPGYLLEVRAGELDLHRFQQMHDDARPLLARDPDRARSLLRDALGLWRGPPLADFAYEPFAQPEIARLDELRIAAVEDRVEADMALDQHAEVVGELELLVSRHPLRERLRTQLMIALYRSGRQAEALDAYQDARAVLTGELGIDPSRELREVQEAILRQDPELDRRPVSAVATGGAERALVGRDRELTELTRALQDAVAGRGQVVLVSGEPGIGKSRLAEELAGRARTGGARVLVGRCWEAGGAPAYWPWVQALRTYVRDCDPETLRRQLAPEGAEMATILPEVRHVLPDVSVEAESASEGARFRLLVSVTAFLARVASGGPIALFLDDLHAADVSSLLLLRFAAAQLADSPILIVACYRDTEAGPDLTETLAELSREPVVRRLALRGLSAPDTARLLEQAMGGEAADELTARVQSETGGNPLFAMEIGRLLATEGGEGRGRLPIPDGVRETIARRLGRQSSRCREVLMLASVVGREFDPEVIGRAGGLDEDELFRGLDEAADARLVGGVPEAGGRLRFSHILVRDALYEDLPAPRRLRLHHAVAEALEILFAANPESHLSELAHHYLEAGTAVAAKAAEYAQRAGDRAASQHGYEEAARSYASALGVLERTGSADAERTCNLLLSLGEALSRSGRGQEATRALEQAAALAEEAGRPDQFARAALAFGGRFAWVRASADAALVPLLERALASLGHADTPTRVRLLARLAAALRDEPSGERRASLADDALAIARRLDDPATLAFALEGHWVAIEGPDSAGGGIAMGEKLIALGEQTGDRERVFAGHDHRLHNFWQLGDRAGVEVELDALGALVDELRQPAQRWHVGTGHTMLAIMEGRFDRAEELVAETLAVGQRAQTWNAVVSHRLALFVLRRAQGRLAELEDAIGRSVHEYPALLRFRCALVHLHGELGHDEDVRKAFEDLRSLDLGSDYRDAEWFFSLSLLADPCALIGDRSTAETLYSLMVPYERRYAQAPVEASFGSMARGLGVLATSLDRFDAAERHFDAAIETERRMGALPWIAHAQHGLGAMLLTRAAAGDRERARTVLDEALARYRELGMEMWAARASALS